MRRAKLLRPAGLLSALILAALPFAAQTPQRAPASGAATPPGRGARGGGGFRNAFPQHAPSDPAAVERGKALYGVNCNFCHGSDARGGEGGPNLLRSEIVLNDQHGELIAKVVQQGRGEMPKFNLTDAQVSDIAAYVHSFFVSGYEPALKAPPSILVGNAAAGEAVFKTKCASCHSATGDLKDIASKIPDPKILQNTFLMPGGGRGGRGGRGGPAVGAPPVTVTVTAASGEKAAGRLVRIDDFTVTLVDAAGDQRTFSHDNNGAKVEIHDPLQAHREMLPQYTDKEIHELTSYLVTLK